MRTNTSTAPSFPIDPPSSPSVTFVLPSPENLASNGPRHVTIILPERSKYTPGLHWHERYVEFFKVLKGRARLVLNNVVKIVTPEDGQQRIEKFVVHEFMRADLEEDEPGDEGDVVVQEWVEPADGVKEVFFRNVFSVVKDSTEKSPTVVWLQMLLIMNTYDNFDVLVEGRLSWWVTHAVWSMGSFVARLLGLSPWYVEYTPERLRSVASAESAGKEKIYKPKKL